MELKGGAAIVTGSSSGVGAAAALQLAGRGANVMVNCARSVADGEAVVRQCKEAGADAVLFQGDVSDDAVCRQMAAQAMERWGRIDALVNSAGMTKFVSQYDLEGMKSKDFMRILSVNTLGPFQMSRAVAPHMKAGGQGAIVNVSSVAGIRGTGSSIAYAASKAALNVMTQSLARVLAPEIRVNTVCPAFIQGRWLQDALGDRYENAKVTWEKTAPLQHAATTDEVAGVVLWLLEGAVITTGQIVVCDSGMILGSAQGVHTPPPPPGPAAT